LILDRFKFKKEGIKDLFFLLGISKRLLDLYLSYDQYKTIVYL